jgi:sugar lactone lactonase YvrE
VTTFSVSGTILAISPDGQFLLISDNVNNLVQYFSVTGGVIVHTQPNATATSSTYTPDSAFNAWVSTLPTPELAVGLPTGFLAGFPTSPYTPNFMDIMAQGGLIYVTSSTPQNQGIYTYFTCNQIQNQVLSAASPTLIKAIPNGTGAVAIDPPSIDVISTQPLVAGCPNPPPPQSAINTYDLGVGSFTPAQLLVSTDSSTAWVLSASLGSVVRFDLADTTPSTIGIAGGATPNNGGLSLDGTQLWVGTSDNTMHRIDTVFSVDSAQVAVNLTDANGNVTPPNLVCVLP